MEPENSGILPFTKETSSDLLSPPNRLNSSKRKYSREFSPSKVSSDSGVLSKEEFLKVKLQLLMLQHAYKTNTKRMEEKLTNEINLHAEWLKQHKKDLNGII
jgi:hypothetical protein